MITNSGDCFGALKGYVRYGQTVLALVLLSFYQHGPGSALASTKVGSSFVDPNRQHSAVVATNLKTEHLTNPLGIQTKHPRFCWQLESAGRAQAQRAYQVLVATSLERLRDGIADKWDSGKVEAGDSMEVLYAGNELVSGERAYWVVRVWDEQGIPSAYSPPSFFEMGLNKPSDWEGLWIAADRGISSPIFRREFTIEAPVRRARAYISGLGWYELSLNGQKVGNRVLDPASTNYDADPSLKLKSRVLYTTFDVTTALKVGKNALGVMLGHGWYSREAPSSDVVMRRAPYADRPILRLQLNVELTNGKYLTVASDDSWKSSSGPVTYNDIANGEVYDAQQEQPGWDSPGFDSAGWEPVQRAKPPSSIATSQLSPPERVVQTLPVVKIIYPKEPELFEYTRIYDFGQDFSGWARLLVSGPRGAKVRLQYVSRVYPDDNTPDDRSNNSAAWEARQTDTYILKGTGMEVWEPRFTLHGFRYVEVRTSEEDVFVAKLEGRFVRSAVEAIGSFVSSNELLDRIHHNIQWTLMSSFQGIPQDAAERGERVAYLGDVGVVAEDYLYNYDMVGFWEKWLDDIQDNQNKHGSIPIVAPSHLGPMYADRLYPSFQSAYPVLLWNLYWYCGDKTVLQSHYRSLVKLVLFQNKAAENDLVADEPLGDHMEPQANGFSSFAAKHTPQALTANAYYYYTVMLTSRIAAVLGRKVEAEAYSKRAKSIREAFNRRFFHSKTNQYGTASQTSNALPLSLEIVPPKNIPAVMRNILDDIVRIHDGHLSTGIIGSNAIVQALPRYGAAEAMYKLANQTTYPSLGDQVRKGMTSVCESYECGPWLSQNMKMFASLDKFFYHDLAGIQPASPGFQRVLIQPQPVGDLKSVTASLRTVLGTIAVEWNRGRSLFDLRVSIPPGGESDIVIPCLGMKDVQISESGTPIWKSSIYLSGVAGVTGAEARVGSIVVHAGSGIYHFVLTGVDQ